MAGSPVCKVFFTAFGDPSEFPRLLSKVIFLESLVNYDLMSVESAFYFYILSSGLILMSSI